MGKLIFLCVAATSCCFSASQEMWPNLTKAWQIACPSKIEEGIAFLSDLINDPLVSVVDKIHYLCSRTQLFALLNRTEEVQSDRNTLRELCNRFEECRQEMWLYYEHSFDTKL